MALYPRIPTGGHDTTYSRQSISGWSVTNSSGTSLARTDMVHGDHGVVVRGTAASTTTTYYHKQGADSASSAGALVSVGLPAERENLMAAGFPSNVEETIQSARAPSTRGLCLKIGVGKERYPLLWGF